MIDTIEMVGAADLLIDLAEQPKTITKALVRALNRSINSARTAVVQQMARDTGLKSKDINAALELRQAWVNGEFNSIEASLKATLVRLKLSKFNPSGPRPSRGKGRGVSYRLGSARRTVPNAFLATMRSGHEGVFKRVGDSARKSAGARGFNLPIVELKGPSLGHVFKKFRQLGIDRAKEVFEKNFEHELKFEASGSGGTSAGAE